MTETGRLGAFITKVKKGSLADVVGHLRAGTNRTDHFYILIRYDFTVLEAKVRLLGVEGNLRKTRQNSLGSDFGRSYLLQLGAK